MRARRTLRNAYLSMVSEGARSPAENAAAEKRGPSGTHCRVGVIEHGRPRSDLSQAPTHNHHANPFFAKNVSENVGRVVAPTGAAREYQPSNDFLQHWQIRPRELRESCPGLSLSLIHI